MKKDTLGTKVSTHRIIKRTPPLYQGRAPVDLYEANFLYKRYCDEEILLPQKIIEACLELQREEIEKRTLGKSPCKGRS